MGIRQGQRAGRACAAWGLWRAPCRRGAGWDTSPPPAILNKASESAAPATAPRSQSCGGETASEASSAAFRPSPTSRPACAWGPAERAGRMKAGVLRCCWIAASDSYVYMTTETILIRYFLYYKQKIPCECIMQLTVSSCNAACEWAPQNPKVQSCRTHPHRCHWSRL